MSKRNAYRGELVRTFMDRPYKNTVVLCSPGDWPAILGQIPESEWDAWSTIDLGPHFLAIGPPSGAALDWLAEHVVNRDALPARVPADSVIG